ncbi:hypothetical protein Q787_03380 [Ornithobacterium rhinotracheale H06-030791]|nr:hypothetical protein Q785_03505 [Ornithobacterium rhinotracheale ORT-UMN 88]KGB67262.1 hypothetical protein Q787_03380 [Ornithobacterium rhinotracheale H06-030791]
MEQKRLKLRILVPKTFAWDGKITKVLLKSQIGVFSPKKIAEQNPCDFIFFNV